MLFLAGYHRGGLDQDLLANIGRVTRGGELPFVALCDFNSSAAELAKTGWAKSLGATVITPGEGDGEPTCWPFLVISDGLLPLFRGLWAQWSVPFAPHAALRLLLSAEARETRVLTQMKPRKLCRR